MTFSEGRSTTGLERRQCREVWPALAAAVRWEGHQVQTSSPRSIDGGTTVVNPREMATFIRSNSARIRLCGNRAIYENQSGQSVR